MMHKVFIDESGTTHFNENTDKTQPVCLISAVIINEQEISRLNEMAEQALVEFGLPSETEIHAIDCINRSGPYSVLSQGEQGKFLKHFISAALPSITAYYYMGMLKPWVKPDYRKKMEKRGVDPYTVNFMFAYVIIDRYFEHILNSSYEVIFDQTHKKKDILRLTQRLLNSDNPKLRINRLRGLPKQASSKSSRVIQLADVIGYYLNRHRQLEIPKFNHRPALDKHADDIFEVYQMIEPKLLDWNSNGLYLLIDWKALDTFALTEEIVSPQKAAKTDETGPDFGPFTPIKKLLVALHNLNRMNQEVFDALQSQFIDQLEETEKKKADEFIKRTSELFQIIATNNKLQLNKEIQSYI